MATVQIEVPDDCLLSDERIDEVRAELTAIVDSDGEPLESPWHRSAINLLIDILIWRWRGRTNFFVGGNMFVFYSLPVARKRLFKGPDFLFVDNVDGTRKRHFWWAFEEDNRYPDAIVELSSPTTREQDHTTKKDIYEKTFRTPEYFIYDPDTRKLEGWRLVKNRYQELKPDERGWLWSDKMQAWLGTWEGEYLGLHDVWLRYFDKDGRLLPTQGEDLAAEVARLKAQVAAQTTRPDNEKGSARPRRRS